MLDIILKIRLTHPRAVEFARKSGARLYICLPLFFPLPDRATRSGRAGRSYKLFDREVLRADVFRELFNSDHR